MRDFIKGWRRKVGCVLLIAGGAFTGLWVRSGIVKDTLTVNGMELRSWDGEFERSDFMFYDIDNLGCEEVRVVYWRIPYAWIASPLLAASACLLLSKPRPAKPSAQQST